MADNVLKMPCNMPMVLDDILTGISLYANRHFAMHK